MQAAVGGFTLMSPWMAVRERPPFMVWNLPARLVGDEEFVADRPVAHAGWCGGRGLRRCRRFRW